MISKLFNNLYKEVYDWGRSQDGRGVAGWDDIT